MKSLSQADIARRADIIARLDGGIHALDDGHADLLLAIGEYNAKVEAYNEVLEEARGFAEDIASEIESYIEEKSEKWQEGDKGQAYSAWRDEWQAYSPEPLELVEEPGKEAPDHSLELDGLPVEPSE